MQTRHLQKKTSLNDYLEKLKTIPAKNKIILGSAWKSDLAILNNPKLIDEVKAKRLHVLIAPHKLDADFVAGLQNVCESYFGSENVEVVSDKSHYKEAPVVILQMSGILCELYSLFSQTYVGGGYERSIHSVLEPFFSNNLVVCGPKITRSTEYDLAHELVSDEIHVLNNPESFYTVIESSDLTGLNIRAREEFRDRTELEMKLIIKEILN